MNALVKIVDGDVRTSSRIVAEVFDKSHKHVLEAIDKIVERKPELHGPNFRPMFEKVTVGNGAKRNVRVFEMDRDGFTLVAMGFTGEKALDWKVRYIEAFNAMEAALHEGAVVGGDLLATPDQVERTRVALSVVREARVIYGRGAAKEIWQRLGLPAVEPDRCERRRLGTSGLMVASGTYDMMRQWAATDPSKRLKTVGRTGVTIPPSAATLHADYVQWCEQNNCQPAESYELSAALMGLGVAVYGY